MDSSSESREDVLHVPNLFDYFCNRTAEDILARGSADNEAPATSFASLIITILMAFAFYVFDKPQLAKAAFVIFGLLLLWTIWGVVIRSSQQIGQKADNIRAGVFPPASAPVVLARLKWWNHLIAPLRWGRHSRLFDRRMKLERRIEELTRRMTQAAADAGTAGSFSLPSEDEAAALADKVSSFLDRNNFEMQAAANPDAVARLHDELLLHMALLHKLGGMADKLDRIEKLAVTFQNVSPDDLSQVVAEAIQLLEERRILVLNVDNVDPNAFIDLVTVRST